MTNILRIFGLLATVVFVGLYWHLHLNPNNPYHKIPYGDLKTTRDLRAHLVQAQEGGATSEEKDIRTRLASESKKQVTLLDREILLRQLSAVVGFIAVGLFSVAVLMGLFGVGGGRMSSRMPRRSIAERRHPGKINIDPQKVEYIDADDYARKVRGAFPDQDDAEIWLRMDDFLRCLRCDNLADIDDIGTVQEIAYFEEAKGEEQSGVQRLGSVWTARPIDRYTCKRCGEVRKRSVR